MKKKKKKDSQDFVGKVLHRGNACGGETVVHVAGTVIFSQVDLVRGFRQVSVLAEDIPKTVIITPLDLFDFLYVPVHQSL